MNWTEHIAAFIRSSTTDISAILDATGCREGWFQGQLYLFSKDSKLKLNASPHKYDISADSPPMVGEVKICGGDYQPKMKGIIIQDVAKLRKAEAGVEKLMILVIDVRNSETPLGRWLLSPGFAEESHLDVTGENFKAVIWKIK